MRLTNRGFLTGLGLFVCLVAMFSLRPSSAAAATSGQGFNVITSPLPIKITAVPGQTVTQTLRIKNQGDQPEGIKVGLMKFGASGSNGTPDLYKLTPKDTFSSWVSFSPEQFTAQPNIWDNVVMTIKIPQSAGFGYYLAVTFSSTMISSQTGATNLNGEVATLILLNVQVPNEQADIKLVSFQTDHGLYEYLPVNFSVKVHNSGNIFIAPVGNIFIQKGGKTIDTLDVNDAGGNVLPGTNRVYTVPWTDGFPVFTQRLVDDKPVEGSNGLPEENLKWDFTQASKFRFGKYTAELLFVYNNGANDIPLQSSVTFWVLPWKLMIIVLILILAILFGLYTLVRSIIRRAHGGATKIKHYAKKR